MFGRTMVPVAVRRVLHCLGDALFPGTCLACGRLFHRGAAAPEPADGPGGIRDTGFAPGTSLYFCPTCRAQWTPVASPLCSRCGLVFKSREGEDHLCGRCLDRPGSFARARAAGIYDQSLRRAVHELKFRAAVGLAAPLGALLFNAYRTHWKAGDIDVVAPVPLHRRRFRQRGFNQAWLLVKNWPLSGGTELIHDLLVRTRETSPQTGLDRRQRRGNIKNAISVRRPGQVSGKRVLLVDDVLTTGATADACAHALVRDGAGRVDVLTLARAL
jgi:ComF family protein